MKKEYILGITSVLLFLTIVLTPLRWTKTILLLLFVYITIKLGDQILNEKDGNRTTTTKHESTTDQSLRQPPQTFIPKNIPTHFYQRRRTHKQFDRDILDNTQTKN